MLLKDEKYVAIGDLLWKVDEQNGNYNIPLSMKFGKLIKVGKQPIEFSCSRNIRPKV